MARAHTVCITGYGVVSALGHDFASFDAALFGGRSSVRAYRIALPGAEPFLAPLARCDFNAAAQQSASRLPLDRGSAMSLAAAESAVLDARLPTQELDHERLGVYWGSGMGGADSFESNCRALFVDQRRLRPTSVVTVMPNAPVAELALRFKAQGAAQSYACACASAAVAIGEALRALREGRLDVAIVGGSDAMLTDGVISGWQALKVLGAVGSGSETEAARACRPFAANRNGFALGEGAAAFVLETAAHARARGAARRLLLSGYASTCDATHMTKPDADGQARALRAALQDAGLRAADIGHVNAHGTATVAGDAVEAESLRRVFGGATAPAVTATKAIVGHLLGAGGAIELAATLRALELQRLPPTAGVDAVDPAFEIDLVLGAARPAPLLQHALSGSFAFGGTNAVLIASRDS